MTLFQELFLELQGRNPLATTDEIVDHIFEVAISKSTDDNLDPDTRLELLLMLWNDEDYVIAEEEVAVYE